MVNRGRKRPWIVLGFDIETCSPDKLPHLNDKVLAIGVKLIEYKGSINTMRNTKSNENIKNQLEDFGIKSLIDYDEECNKAEQKLLNGFKKLIENIPNDATAVLTGFNILRFDIPLLTNRSLANRVFNDLTEAEEFFFNNKQKRIFVVDLLDIYRFATLPVLVLKQDNLSEIINENLSKRNPDVDKDTLLRNIKGCKK
ncbi:3'-5' exonuclease [Caldivirga maquilingensis]|uniref:DNA-directed DNA polymerase family B exonuclease domain-containing protein n=1 Tax=Caldivirga maquilingensis (strain ATCC 700844 / DSM 13496 / JCM 10307 / IC-167) TaxID=397948 RepID=A8M927_CALMQ|nr:3'-5' exonuclease [Caldivirga maquilingensis]ABW02246.1 hypothetical protein Cmaq_1421 [Caldivirga maquilingensis IC-167]